MISLQAKAEFKVEVSNGQANNRSIVEDLEQCMDWQKEMEAGVPSECLQSVENNPAAVRNERCRDGSLNSRESIAEAEMVKEKNRRMEKEMEERYSEVSLRFAMAESEREQLVMTMRNLKNNSKNNK